MFGYFMNDNILRYQQILEKYKKLNDNQRLNIKEVLAQANTSFESNEEILF